MNRVSETNISRVSETNIYRVSEAFKSGRLLEASELHSVEREYR